MMALQRRANSKPPQIDEEASHDPVIGMPHTKQRTQLHCTTCGLLCFGLLIFFSGTLLGMFFKNHILQAYYRTADHITTTGLPMAAETLSRPFRKVDLSDAGRERAANAATEADGNRIATGWHKPWVNVTVCDDSCPSSKNRVCNDGRSGFGEVLCDLGTDCSDCGAWQFQMPDRRTAIPQPIQLLREHRTTVNIAPAATYPPFLMPYTDPNQDIDVSAQMANGRVVELGLTQAWYKTLNDKCKTRDGEQRLVLDVGANFGYYTFYAAKHGCRVVAWEPVPIFRAFLEYGLQVNNMSQSVRVRDHVVGEKAGVEYELTVPQQGIWGTASVNGRNIDEWTVGGHVTTVKAVSERVDSLIHEDALLIKLDVEGFEPSAFQSMKGVFDNHKVGSFFMEYSPGVYERSRMWDELADMPNMLTYLLDHGFTILHINDSLARGQDLLRALDWSGELPALEEITSTNMKHDVEDVKKLQKGTLGCYAPEDLVRLNKVWESCNNMPEDLHPKGFRGTFGHNTNIWAAADRKSLKVGTPVGIQAPQQPETDWYGKNPAVGMGGRTCSTVRPDEFIVKHRCPCFKPGCKDEAKLVEKFARKVKHFCTKEMGKLSNRAT